MAGSSLVKRAVAADAELWADWADALRAIPENPFAVEVRAFGSATAILAHAAPTSFFNRVIGMSSQDLDRLGDVISYYRDRQTPCRIDVPPGRGTALLAHRLSALGWQAVNEQVNLIARLDDIGDVREPRLEIREVTLQDADAFAELYDRAYALDGPPLLARFRRSSLKARVGRPGWKAYVAFVDGHPAGGGLLHLGSSTASLSGGATLPEFRRNGVQSALLDRRLLDARSAGCGWVVSRCSVGSASQRNLERAGLRLIYTKSIWEWGLDEGVAGDVRSVITAA